MPVLSPDDYAYMEGMVEEVLPHTATHLQFTVTYDDFGGEQPSYVEGESFPCAYQSVKRSEAFNEAGQYYRHDGLIRVPRAKWLLFGSRDRIKVAFRNNSAEAVTFDIIGEVVPGEASTVIGVRVADAPAP